MRRDKEKEATTQQSPLLHTTLTKHTQPRPSMRTPAPLGLTDGSTEPATCAEQLQPLAACFRQAWAPSPHLRTLSCLRAPGQSASCKLLAQANNCPQDSIFCM